MKKALWLRLNGTELAGRDIGALASGFQKSGYDTDIVILSKKDALERVKGMPIEEYSAIFLPFVFVSKFDSGGTVASAFKNVLDRASKGSISGMFVDTTFPLDPYLWDEKDSGNKINIWNQTPVKILASFQKEITLDDKAMKVLNQRILKKIHPESQFIPLEWTIFHKDTVSSAMEESKKVFKKEKIRLPRKIERFYYGAQKKKLVSSLKLLGLGTSKDDKVFGRIGDFFPTVENITPVSQSRKMSHLWVPYAERAEKNLYPYEEVKGDYQFTLRNLELSLLCDEEQIVCDPRVSDYVQQFFHKDAWENKETEVLKQLAETY